MTEHALISTEPGQPPALSDTERQTLADHEKTISRGLETFYEVGAALQGIRDGRLYRETHATFEAYTNERWDIERNYANKLIAASAVVSNLGTTVPKPTSEWQTRGLTKLDDPEAQRIVWEVAQQTAPGGKVTAPHVQSVVRVFKQVTEFTTTHIVAHNGEESDLIKSLVTEETVERMRNQQLYVTGAPSDPPKRLVNARRKIHSLQRAFLTFRVTQEEFARLMDASDRGDEVRLVIYEVPKGDPDDTTETTDLSTEKP